MTPEVPHHLIALKEATYADLRDALAEKYVNVLLAAVYETAGDVSRETRDTWYAGGLMASIGLTRWARRVVDSATSVPGVVECTRDVTLDKASVDEIEAELRARCTTYLLVLGDVYRDEQGRCHECRFVRYGGTLSSCQGVAHVVLLEGERMAFMDRDAGVHDDDPEME